MGTINNSVDLADELASMLNLLQGVALFIESAHKVIISLG